MVKRIIQSLVFGVNLAAVSASAFFFKNQDMQEKEVQIKEEEAYRVEVSKNNIAVIQEKIGSEMEIKKQKMAEIANDVAALKESARNGVTAQIKTSTQGTTSSPVSNKSTSTSKPASIPKSTPAPAPVANKINGKCGSANSSASRSNPKCAGKAPSSSLCSSGSASSISFKPNKHGVGWTWSCAGQNGGSSASCRCS